MSRRISLPLQYNRDTASVKMVRREVKSRRGEGKEHTTTHTMPPWRSSLHSTTVRETQPRARRGSATRGNQGKATGERVPQYFPFSRFPRAPAPTPRTVTPQSAHDKRRPQPYILKPKYLPENPIKLTSATVHSRKSPRSNATSKRSPLSTKSKEKKKDDKNDNYPDAMKSAENSTTSLIKSLFKSDRRKEKSQSWKLVNQTLRDDILECTTPHPVTYPRDLHLACYHSATGKQSLREDDEEMVKSVWEDDPATMGVTCPTVINPVTSDVRKVNAVSKPGKLTPRGTINSRGIVLINVSPTRNSRNHKVATITRLIDPAPARNTRIGSKLDEMKSRVAATQPSRDLERRGRSTTKVIDKSTDKAVNPRQRFLPMSNPSASSKRKLTAEEGHMKRKPKHSIKDMHIMPYLLPSIPEGQTSDERSQNYYTTLSNLVSWKDSVRALEYKISQASAATGIAPIPKASSPMASKERPQGLGSATPKETSRSISNKIRSTFVKQRGLLLDGTGEHMQSKSRRKVPYPKELMSASESESDSKVKYNPCYIQPPVSLARANNFKRFLNFNIVLPGTSADIYPWCMSNDRVHNPTYKRVL